MIEAAIFTCRWLGLRPTHPPQRDGFCLRRFFMVSLPHGREIQGSRGVRSLLLRSVLRLVRLNCFSACCRTNGSLLRRRADTAAIVKTGSPYTGADGIPGLRRVFVALALACAGMPIYLGFSS
jgi:hypothetical protein